MASKPARTEGKGKRGPAGTDHYPVTDYSLFLATHMTKSEKAHFYAYIVCRGQAGQTLTFYFVRPGEKVPTNSYDPAQRRAVAFLPPDQYLWYVDILRHESPVFAYVSQPNPEWNRLHTGPEPVGEGE